jgi:glycerophosphoryl diester phosphodiesterase
VDVISCVQVTADGIPVIWHDDNVLTFSEGSMIPSMRNICDLTLEEFKQLCPARNKPSPTITEDGTTNQAIDGARQHSHSEASTSQACEGRLARFFNSEDGKRQVNALPWAVSDDDELPTLAEVFKARPSSPVSPLLGATFYGAIMDRIPFTS